MRAARQYHVDSIDEVTKETPRAVKVSRRSQNEETVNRNIFDSSSERVEETQEAPLGGLGLLTQVAYADYGSDPDEVDEIPGTEQN